MLAALILTTVAAQAAPPEKWAENPGPHTIKRTQPSCQNISTHDELAGKILLAKTPLQKAEARAYYQAHTDPNDPRNGGNLCIPLKKGTVVMVEKRIGRFECVRFKGMPIAIKPWEDKCFYAERVSSYADVTVHPDFYWLE
ncbi:hypothetical protein MKK55_07615 [Methylobacterium sp. J-059]|uniref:hypothetical protein n=1 Tax=Methylobacterium sp. J-059 TaxID=2836643 RepID=UPI001FBBDB34|nr:hypothetical protein [Methylobacterium sp. J-059]MCJ2038822.1 hypothetical protein [Methylobacterium sp. J-059]